MDSWLFNSFTSASLKSVSNFLIPTGFLFFASVTSIGSLASGENSVLSFLLPKSDALLAWFRAFLIPDSLISLVVVIPTKLDLFQTLKVKICFCYALSCLASPLSTCTE